MPQALGAHVVASALALALGGMSAPAPAAADSIPPLPTLEASPQGQWVRQNVAKVLAHPITLDDAVRVALLNHPELIRAYRELGVTPADVVRSGLFNAPEQGFNLRRDFLGLPVSDGQRPARLPDRQRVEIASMAAAVAAEVIDAYLALAALEAELPAMDQLVDADTAALELAAGQRKAGNLSAYKALPYKVAYAEAVYARDLARVERENARLRLARLMGISADALPPGTAGLPALPDTLPASGELRRVAWLNRADALQADAALRRDNPFGNPTANPEYRDVLPLVSPSRILRTEARLPEAEIEVLEVRHRVASEIGDAEGRLRIAHARATKLDTLILPARAEMTEEALKHYNGMLIGVYELLEAKRSEIEKQREYYAAVRDFWVAYFDLERAVGGQLPEASTLRLVYGSASQAAAMTPAAETGGGHSGHH
jgi:cobalt-zinc-cadmium efflux system outer membrane protein